MALNSLSFLLRECFLNIRRNSLMSLAALGTVTACLIVLGGLAWTTLRIHEIAQQQPQRIDQIDVFLKVETERAQTLAMQARIQRMPGVKVINLIPKERAWKNMQNSEPNLAQAMPDNPLPDMLEVVPTRAADMGRLTQALRDSAQFPEVSEVTDASRAVKTMLGFARLVDVLGGSVALGLFVATLFIVHNTIRLTVFARRREIRIMQLVGATSGFIRFPLLLEGLFHGVVGAALAGGLLLLGGREVSRFVAQVRSPLIGDAPSLIGPGTLLLILVGIGAFTGVFGSYLSMRRFLKQV